MVYYTPNKNKIHIINTYTVYNTVNRVIDVIYGVVQYVDDVIIG